MRKTLVRPLISLFSTFQPPSNGEVFHLVISPPPLPISRRLQVPITASNPKRLFTTTSSIPPPEWVEPFDDISGIIVSDPKQLEPSAWVPRILAILDNSPSMESHLTDYCGKFLIKLTPNFVAFLLDCPQLKSQPETAFRLFSWAAKQKRYKHKLECYVALIHVLTMSDDVDRIKGVFREFARKDFLMDIRAANSLIRSFGSLGMVEELLWVWRRMKENCSEPPSLYTYNFLMNGLVMSMLIDSAEQVFEVMENGKIRPDTVTYNTLIKGYCKAGKTGKAMRKFKEMEVESVKPDKITYMTLIQACYSEGDIGTCLSLYHEMEEKRLEIPPHAYSLVIGGLCKDGRYPEGYMVFQDMIGRGCKANVAIYTALIDSSVKIGNVEEAMCILKRMENEGFKPDEVTYGAIINGLCKNGRLDEALEYFSFCRGNEVGRGNAVLYASLIDGLGKAGRVEEAVKLFEEMPELGCSPDSYCYNALIDALAKRGDVDEALALFEQMDEEGCDQTVYSYTILMDGLFKRHRNEEALKLWNRMIDKGITPTPPSAPMAMDYFNMLAMASSPSSSSSRGGGGGGGGGGSVNNNNNNGSNSNNNGNPNHSSPGFPRQIQLGNSMSQTMMVSPFSVAAGDHHHSELHQFPFVSDHLVQNTAAATGNDYNLNFSISPSGLAGFNRGTLQSNSPSQYTHLQRFSALDGTSLPFFLGAAAVSSAENQHNHQNHQHHQQQFPPGLQLCYGDGGRQPSDQKGKGKN